MQMVFQNPYASLNPRLTVNAILEEPLELDPKYTPRDRVIRVKEVLDQVGLNMSFGERYAHELSGGQRQRVAIARALANNPAIIMADEPTGNLDSKSTIDVMNIFRGLHDEGRTILLVTHEPDIATYASRNVVLKDGIIVEDSINSNMTPIKEVLNV